MSPKYSSDVIPSTTRRYASRNVNSIPLVRVNKNYFMNTFFPSTIPEWNKLDLSIRNSTNLNIFKGRLFQFVKLLENSAYTCHNPKGIKYKTEPWYQSSSYHKFKLGFLDDVAAAQQSVLFITSFTVPTFQLREIPFSMKSKLLIDQLLIKTKSKLFKNSFMIIQLVLSMITNQFLMQV